MVDNFIHFHTHIAGKMVHWREPLNHSFHISELSQWMFRSRGKILHLAKFAWNTCGKRRLPEQP
jgi:hypothetical protein